MTFNSRPARTGRTLTLAIAGSLPLMLALSAGTAVAMEPPVQVGSATLTQMLTQAQERLDAGQPILARALVQRAMEQAAGQAAAAEVRQAQALSMKINEAIGKLSPTEASLQRAEVALNERNVRTADQHLKAVLGGRIDGSTRQRAEALQQRAAAARAEFQPIVADTLVQAERDFLAGRYAQAKAGLSLVDRSGVQLTADQQSTLDRYQLRLVELADQQPGLFGDAGQPAMMQPGVVRRREEQPAQPAPEPAAAQPAEPAVQPAAEPAPAMVPEPAPTEVAQVQPGDSVMQPAADPIAAARQAEVTDLISQADRAFQEKRYADALTRYERLRIDFGQNLSPDETQVVERRISECRVMLQADRLGQPANVLRDGELLKQQVTAEFRNDLDVARKALAAGNATEASNRVAQARLRLAAGRNYFGESELENLQNEANQLAAQIEKDRLTIEAQRAQERDAEIAKRTAENQKNATEERNRKIAELIERARAFQAELRYAEAEQTIDQLLFLDQNNPTGMLLKELLRDIQTFRKFQNQYDEKQARRARISAENGEATVPPLNLVDYPPDWPAISARRGEPVQFAEAPENRRLLADLSSRRVATATFNENTLEEAVRFVQTVAQVNMDVDWASLEEAGIRRDTTISLTLSNVTIKQLLDRIVEKVSGTDRSSRADWATIDGVVTLASDQKIRRNRVLVIYDVKDLLIQIPDYTDAPRIDLQQALQASQGGGGGQAPFQDEDQEREADEGRRERLMTDLQQIIVDNVDTDGWIERGGETGAIRSLVNSGSFIITTTPKNHREISGLLRKLRDIRSMQINVECRFLLVNQDFFEQIGFDLDVYLNANNNQVRTARRFDPSIQSQDFFDFSGAGLRRDVQGSTRRVPGTAPTSTVATTVAPTTGTAAITQGVVNPASWSPIGFGQNSLGLTQTVVPRSANWGDVILSRAPALGIAGQFLDDIQVDFLIKATQADRRSAQLTAPRLTFTNGQTSNIYVATQTAFVSNLTPITSDSAVGFQPTVGVVTEGVTLLVEGIVSADRRYVTMTIDGGVSRVNGFANQAVSAVAGGQLVNSASVQSFIQLPQITVTRVRTTVTVPDQGTLLLGGQRLVTEYEVETGVPVLSKLPIINRFFTNRIESKEEQTLMVLIKPTIMIQNEEEEKAYPGLLQQLNLGTSR